jgi:glutaminyl-tRNA synthetase
MAFLESAIREDLEGKAPRVMAVMKPLKVVLTNFDANTSSRVAAFHPQHPELGERLVELTPEIYIEQDDFMQEPMAKWQRLAPGAEVRLRHSYVIRCDEVIANASGEVVELRCSIDPDTLGKNPEGRKVKGVIHWVSTTKAITAEVRLYDRLFNVSSPLEVPGHDFEEFIIPLSSTTAYIEPAINTALPEQHYQFERLGYYVTDRFDCKKSKLVFNKIVGLRDTWNKDVDK